MERDTRYHTPTYGRWATPAAPTFDATGMPKKNNYKPQATPLHYADDHVAKVATSAARSRKSAQKLHAKIESLALHTSRPVRLIRPDGAVIRASMKPEHGAIVAPTVVIKRADLSKVTDQHVKTTTNDVPLANPAIVHFAPLAPSAPLAVVTVERAPSIALPIGNRRAPLAGATHDRAGFVADIIHARVDGGRLALDPSHLPQRKPRAVK